MKIPHLVQYQGSKRNLAHSIYPYFPKQFDRLIEPFSGTAAITLLCAYYKNTDNFIINDLNKPLIELLKLVVNNPKYVADKYEEIWKDQHYDSIEHYYQIREKFNLTNDPVLFLYLLARCVKGSVRYNSEGLFNQSPDKRRLGTNPKTMRQNIDSVSFLLKNKITFFSSDYKTILEIAQPGDVVYMDPPYQGVCGERDSRYFSGINHTEFVSELEKLNYKGISYLVSYDGICGDKNYGEKLPDSLNLEHISLNAGRSSQATLLGKDSKTVESLYVTKDLLFNYMAFVKFEEKNGELFC